MSYEKIYFELLNQTPGLLIERASANKAAEAWKFLTSGYQKQIQNITNSMSLYPCQNNGLVLVKNIEFISLCEHHLMPMFGQCHIAYDPQGKILGLGKFTEIVNIFAHRLQLQEQLTTEITQAIADITDAKGVGVLIEARHLCLMMQGVEKINQTVETSHFIGSLQHKDSKLFC